jgi:uridine phosphorylase
MTRTAASPWKNDRPPHLPCSRGQLPAAVLFPGDPARVDRFASILDNFRILGQNREFRIGVGSYRGLEIGICSTGIGGPSTEIALVEAAELGCKLALRIGGTGALQPDIPLGSLLIVSDAERTGGAAALYAPASHPATAHPAMLTALTKSAEAANIPHRTARVASIDGYYAGQGRTYPHATVDADAILNGYREKNVSTLDMESETILILGEKLQLIAGAVLAVHANRANDTWLEDYEPAQDRMIRVACETLLLLSK